MLTRQFSQHPGMKGIGFGFWELEIDGRSYWGHDGDVVGWNARALLLPERGLGLFMAYTGTDTLKAFGDRVAITVFGPVAAAERARAAAACGRRGRRTASMACIAGREPRARRPIACSRRTGWCSTGRGVDASGELELSNALGLFPTSRWEPIGVDLFQEVGGSRRLSFRDEGGRITHVFLDTSPIPMAFERIAWWESVPVQATLVVFFLVAFLVMSGGGIVGLFRSRSFSGIAIASATDLAFLIAFPPAMGLHMFASDLLPLPEAIIPHGDSAVLLRRSAGRTATPGAAARGARHRRRTRRSNGARSWGRAGHSASAAFVLLQAGFAAFLHYWNLLGYHF